MADVGLESLIEQTAEKYRQATLPVQLRVVGNALLGDTLVTHKHNELLKSEFLIAQQKAEAYAASCRRIPRPIHCSSGAVSRPAPARAHRALV